MAVRSSFTFPIYFDSQYQSGTIDSYQVYSVCIAGSEVVDSPEHLVLDSVINLGKRWKIYMFFGAGPKGRRNVCYDREGQEARKSEGRPEDNAIDMAAAMGIELLTEEQYQGLQKLGNFDTKTSSWVKTPSDIRKLGGALFADRRYGQCLRVS